MLLDLWPLLDEEPVVAQPPVAPRYRVAEHRRVGVQRGESVFTARIAVIHNGTSFGEGRFAAEGAAEEIVAGSAATTIIAADATVRVALTDVVGITKHTSRLVATAHLQTDLKTSFFDDVADLDELVVLGVL